MCIRDSPGPMAAAFITEIVPRSFVAVEAVPPQSLISVPDLSFTA